MAKLKLTFASALYDRMQALYTGEVQPEGIAPALDEISGSLGEKVKIVKLNVDENPETAAKYGIMSIPTLMIFKNGELASRQVGDAAKQKLEQWINAAC